MFDSQRLADSSAYPDYTSLSQTSAIVFIHTEERTGTHTITLTMDILLIQLFFYSHASDFCSSPFEMLQ